MQGGYGDRNQYFGLRGHLTLPHWISSRGMSQSRFIFQHYKEQSNGLKECFPDTTLSLNADILIMEKLAEV
jgi:hypothetical protein